MILCVKAMTRLLAVSALCLLAQAESATAPASFRTYCFACHGKAASGGINLQKLTTDLSFGDHFQQWEKVAHAIETRHMPPAPMKQPSDEERHQAVSWIRAELRAYALKHDGDPGRVTVRRLTSGEYAYTIKDLTGLDFRSDQDFVPDEVGGEGFTNFGDVQFLQDTSLERYLSAAKWVADRAVIGAGPLRFYKDPGRTGMELSAINRIYAIYNAYGFRASSGEGGRPFGLDRYAKALYAAWRYQHRIALGEPQVTLAQLAKREGLLAPFVEHIWSVLQRPGAGFPTRDVLTRFRALPAPPADEKDVRAACDRIRDFMIDWSRWLLGAGEQAAGGLGDERALILTEETVQALPRQKMTFNVIRRDREASKSIRVFLSFASANPEAQDRPYVLWRDGVIRLRGQDRKLLPPRPLREALTPESVERLRFGQTPDGKVLDQGDFATTEDTYFDVVLPDEHGSFQLQIDAELGPGPQRDSILRCTLSDRIELNKGTPFSALLGHPASSGYRAWKANVLAFAADLPLNSHSEANPSDKDPIPAPYDNTYNQPERDSFHIRVKYHRGDQFLTTKMLDAAARRQLEEAWDDLLSSFSYHENFFQFVAAKYKLNTGQKTLAQLTPAEIAALPAEPRQYVAALRRQMEEIGQRKAAAEPRHLPDALAFAASAYRRPLTVAEKEDLKRFYWSQRENLKLGHDAALRALLARVLVAPAFLYRFEPAALATASAAPRPLTAHALASRLSYFLWSSPPDAELRRAAEAGELARKDQLARQVRRMLADPKARRFATEFFGQWLGFYRFDQYRGIDTTRFPEFSDDIKSAMYDEAVSFFEYIVRQDRPVSEMLTADYTFLNKKLAAFYGVKRELKSDAGAELVPDVQSNGRGGILRLGAIHAATSAPLRTSPVKRGDWVLRRVLGTPTPPPPADAGSIPADEKNFGGLSLRQRLESHKRNASCAGCHNRIDPLGFPFERYDAIGRVRENYPDGKPVDDSAVALDHTSIQGVDGLLAYLRKQDRQVMKNFSNKLVGYALGRTVLASDQPLIEKMTAFGPGVTLTQLATEIVSSRQFLYRREDSAVHPAVPESHVPEKDSNGH